MKMKKKKARAKLVELPVHRNVVEQEVYKLIGTKRHLTGGEEFEIMKLVLDKFLWIGAALLGFGLYQVIAVDLNDGLWFILTGTLVMIVFAWFVVREFERLR